MKTVEVSKKTKRVRRHSRIRATVSGTSDRPRLAVFRSNKFIYAQLIDDENGVTLASASDMGAKETKTKIEHAKDVGLELVKKGKEKKIEAVVFDRGGFNYIGRVKALADAVREGGLKF